MLLVEIYIDGACSGNPGPGGWGAILRYKNQEKCLSGFEQMTTNNRMELMAAIQALSALKKSCIVTVTTDSQYVKNGITQWLPKWKQNHWRKKDKSPILNVDLWQQLDEVCSKHQIEWLWVRGHSGHVFNERADQLARKAILQFANGTSP